MATALYCGRGTKKLLSSRMALTFEIIFEITSHTLTFFPYDEFFPSSHLAGIILARELHSI
jgi:hypothetical protein